MTRKLGFTLIELLVVIAIIAILAAIIFPVFMKAKDSAYRSGDLSKMNDIRNALQLYRADQGGYPPAILGFATVYSSGPNAGQLIPASALRAALYPKRLNAIDGLRPAYDRSSETALVNAVWPPSDPRPTGTAPIKDLNGDGQVDGTDDPVQARQAYGPNLYYCTSGASCNQFSATSADPANALYAISGFDAAEVRVAPNARRWELRYTLRWTNWGVSTGNRNDDPRQLIYNDPPDDTVITWNSWFRDYDAGNVVQRNKKDIVLFLGGSARPYDSVLMNERAWRALP